MAAIAVYPGSFDPLTLGHLDIAARAAKMFDQVHILVVHNPAKTPRFSLEQRVALIEDAIRSLRIAAGSKIVVATLPTGLLVDYSHRVGASALVKGVRTNVDLDYELPMARVNRDLADVETIFIPADPSFGHISSSLVKQVAALGGDVSKYVPAAVAQALKSS
ncbi:MAG: pantetheine-phosphate adenylyltransferase [Micrococcales bacterium]